MTAQNRIQEITLEFVKTLKTLPPALVQFEAEMLPNKLVDQLFLELGIEKDDLDTAVLVLDMENDKEYASMLEDFNQKMELASK